MNSNQLFRQVVRRILTTKFVPRDRFQKRRLRRLLKQAKKNSPFYRELYKDIDLSQITPYNIAELPAVTKSQLIENYDDWVCDADIHKEDVIEYASNVQNIGRLYLDKYYITSTSGSTGEKLKVINEQKDFIEMLAMGAIDTWPKLSYSIDIAKSHRPVVYIAPTDGFYASVLVSRAYMNLSDNFNSEIIDFRVPIDELVLRLNQINPILIGGYVSTFLILADEAKAGRLNINVKYMVSIGTAYSEEDRQRVKEAFDCETFTSYSCTEVGEIGCECIYGHYHLAKGVIVEPVDDNLNVIEDGKESSGVLVTNLWNRSMPFIRYLLNDRCIVHNEQCKCGCKTKWIEVIGREVIRVYFLNDDNKVIQMTDFMFEAILNDICSGKADHQMIIDGNTIEMRFNIKNDFIKFSQFKRIRSRIQELANVNDLSLDVVLSDALPIVDNSGKTKRIIIRQRKDVNK